MYIVELMKEPGKCFIHSLQKMSVVFIVCISVLVKLEFSLLHRLEIASRLSCLETFITQSLGSELTTLMHIQIIFST